MPKRGQVVIDDYLNRIVSGELTEGTLLPTETAMIEHYGISRTAVREAVQTLAHKGFVKIRQGSGSTVAPRSAWNVLDPDYLAITSGGGKVLISHIRETNDILEPALAAAAAQRGEPQDIETLRQIVARMNATSKTTDLIKLDDEFHEAIARATGNAVLASLRNSVQSLEIRSSDDVVDDSTVAQTATWSEYVVDAIASHDTEAARDAMRMHLRKLHRG